MKKMHISKLFFATFGLALMLLGFIFPTNVGATSSTYVKTTYSGSVKCISFYEYRSGRYVRTQVRIKGRKLYFKGASKYLTKSLVSKNQVGFDKNGNLYYINDDDELYYVAKGRTSAQYLDDAECLDFDRNNFVISYKRLEFDDYDDDYYYDDYYDNYSSTPTVQFWNDGSDKVKSYYAYGKTYEARLRGNQLYFRGNYVTSSVLNSQFGFSKEGDLYYINTDYRMYYIRNGSSSSTFVDYAESLDFSGNFVVSYKKHNSNNYNNNNNNNNYTGNNKPYVSSYNQGNSTVLTYYEYNSYRRDYIEYMHVQKTDRMLYISSSNNWVTSDLYSNQYGFSENGDFYYITSDYKLWYIPKGSTNPKYVEYAEYLDFKNNFVISYKKRNNQNNSNYNSSAYTKWDNGRLVLVQSSGQEDFLEYYNDILYFNNIILYKNSVSDYGFYSNGVIYVTTNGQVIKYTFGEKRQTVIAQNGANLNWNNNGMITGYTTYNGYSYNI